MASNAVKERIYYQVKFYSSKHQDTAVLRVPNLHTKERVLILDAHECATQRNDCGVNSIRLCLLMETTCEIFKIFRFLNVHDSVLL